MDPRAAADSTPFNPDRDDICVTTGANPWYHKQLKMCRLQYNYKMHFNPDTQYSRETWRCICLFI